MNRITKSTVCCFALCVMALSSAEFSWAMGGDAEMSVTKRRNDMIISCPTQLSYRVESNPGWDPGYYAIKVLVFEDATVSGRMLTCNYSVNKGSARDSSMLTREMPAGYVCKTELIYGAKNWGFACKRAVAPIKIKPKS